MASHFSGRSFGRRRPATQVKTVASELEATTSANSRGVKRFIPAWYFVALTLLVGTMVWQPPLLVERLPRQGDSGPRKRRYVGETAVDGPLEPGTRTGRGRARKFFPL
jgi:hypothetical protein